MRKFLLAVISFFSVFESFAQDYLFKPDEMSQRRSASEILSSYGGAPGWPYYMPLVQSVDFADLAVHSGTVSAYKFKSVRDILIVGVDHSVPYIESAFRYKVALHIQPYSPDPAEMFIPIDIELFLSYDPDSLTKYQDMATFAFEGKHKYVASISNVYREVSGAYVAIPPDQVAKNFYLETKIVTQRYDLIPGILEHTAASDGRNWNVEGHFPGSGSFTAIPFKPAIFELEWTYVEDYIFDRTSGAKSYAFPGNDVHYNFKRNSTRVQLENPSYAIPLIYEHGALVHRWRIVRPNSTNYSETIYGNWSLPDEGVLAPAASTFSKYALIVGSPHSGDSLNWHYTINFAEGGKYKHVINYFDGTLKNRQTQTRINSQPDKVVAVDKVLDYEGRPSLVSLPTPFVQNGLYYNKNVLLHGTSPGQYNAGDIDQLPGCSRPAAFDILSSSSMANLYYSSANADKGGMQKFVPDAEGYPVVQTIYSPDATNKVLFQGGAGEKQQLWKGAGTQYEYVGSIQPELDKYLGYEAGKQSFYTKQIVTDPNGQSSYSILNHDGKVILSGLQGASPSETNYPIQPLDNFVPGELVCSDVLRNANQSREGNSVSNLSVLYNDNNAGGNTLDYRVKIFPFDPTCSGKYLWAKGTFNLTTFDDCGVSYPALTINGTVGVPAVSAGLGVGYSYFSTDPVKSYDLPKGKFMIDKKLSFSNSEVFDQVKSFVKDNESACYHTEEHFIRNAVEQTKFPCTPEKSSDYDSECSAKKEQMIDELYPDAKYGGYNKGVTGAFASGAPNSIFTVQFVDVPIVPDDLSSMTFERYTLSKGENPKDKVPCSSNPAVSGGKIVCGCTTVHRYAEYCCETCLFGNCECIEFKNISKATGSPKTRMEFKACVPTSSPPVEPTVPVSDRSQWQFGTNPAPQPEAIARESPFGVLAIYQTYESMQSCSCGESHLYERVSYVQYWEGEGIKTLGLTKERHIYDSFHPSYFEWPKTHKCDQSVVYDYDWSSVSRLGAVPQYRYQSDCLRYPDVFAGGKTYRDADIKRLSPQEFMSIFNRDIAEALLPLHPEYCNLLACEAASGPFEQKFKELETFQQAQAVNLYQLDDIISADPLANSSTVAELFPEFGGTVNPMKYFPYEERYLKTFELRPETAKRTIEFQAMMDVYCGLGNKDAENICGISQFNTEICSGSLPTDELRQAYFKRVKSYYLSVRERIKQDLIDRANMGPACSPCGSGRMMLVNPPVFKGFVKGGVLASGTPWETKGELYDQISEPNRTYYEAAEKGKVAVSQSDIIDQFNAAKSDLQSAQLSMLNEALANCDMTSVQRADFFSSVKSQLNNGAILSPEVVKQALIAAFGTFGSWSNHLCHPFLVAYGLQPELQKTIAAAQNFSCKDPTMYSGLREFFNQPGVKNSIKLATDGASVPAGAGTAALNLPGGAFEAQMASLLGLSMPPYPTYVTHTLSIASKLVAIPENRDYCGLYYPMSTAYRKFPSPPVESYVEVTVTSAFNSVVFRVQAESQSASGNLASYISYYDDAGTPVTISKGLCLNDVAKGSPFGIMGKRTAVISAKCSSCTDEPRFWVMSDQFEFMDPIEGSESFKQSITCLDIRSAITDFQTTDKANWGYGDEAIAANHPLYTRALTNYLNYRFSRQFSFEDYENLMKGCALSDYVSIPRALASVRVEVSSASADDFETKIRSYGKPEPGIFRYVKGSSSAGTTGNTIFLLDLGSVHHTEILSLWRYINGTASSPAPVSGVISASWNYSGTPGNLLFVPSSCTFTFPSGTTVSSEDVMVRRDDVYYDFKLHSFGLSSGSPSTKDKADFHDNISKSLDASSGSTEICKNGLEFWSDELMRTDDYSVNALRQSYLSYIYGLGSLTRPALFGAIAPSGLGAHLGSSFSSYDFSYENPFLGGGQNHLHAFHENPVGTLPPGFDLLKNTIISAVKGYPVHANKLYPDVNFEVIPLTTTGTALTVARKANGVYWYRYFDAADHMYNVYLNVPDSRLGRKPSDFEFGSVQPGVDPHFFTVTLSAPATSSAPALTNIKCIGYADFPLTDALVATDVILGRSAKKVFPFDTSDCEKGLLLQAIYNGKDAYKLYFDSTVNAVSKLMMAHLIKTSKDTLIYCGRQQQYQQTLYYYDLAGNLTRTVPPMGVRPLAGSALSDVDRYRDGSLQFPPETVTTADDGTGRMVTTVTFPNYSLTNHKKISFYRYNSLNQLIYQKTPDGGVTYFFYDAAGRQIFSQNSKQRIDGLYSYSLYDAQGRPEESGEVKLGCTYPSTSTADFDLSPCSISYKKRDLSTATTVGAHPDFVTYSYDDVSYPYEDLKYFVRSRTRTGVVRTFYDNETIDLSAIPGAMLSKQDHLRSRVSSIQFYESHGPSYGMSGIPYQATFSTYYSYDLSGNVKNIVYDYPKMVAYEQRYKKVDYDYDLISGKVNMVSYNRGFTDQFYQKYDYDADNRITEVQTSNDGLIWNRDAKYSYYHHGPLARMELGEHKIQSLEYAYTIQGWLKSINGDVLNPSKDMGLNGLSGDYTYARDVLSHALRYYDQDYKAIGTTPVTYLSDATTKNLYNGNISQQTTGIGGLGTMQRVYNYDQLQRLKLATNYKVDDYAASVPPSTPLNLYKSSYAYDMDGNIRQLERWDGNASSPVAIDNFTYNYRPSGGAATENNQLVQVQDAAPATPGSDLQPGQVADNYLYDRIGNLTKDKQGNEVISWDRFGKVNSIRDIVSNRFIQFGYDGKGNRIYKNVITPLPSGEGKEQHEGEYYVRDAGGNILATYRFHSKFNKQATLHELIGRLTPLPAGPLVPGGTPLTEVVTGLTDRSFPTLMIAKMLSDHSSWSGVYTDRPVSFYMSADPSLKSNLLYTGDAWIDELRSVNPMVYRSSFLDAGTDVQGFYESALSLPGEGRKILEHYSREMPLSVCQSIWAIAQAPYLPGNHPVNANALYSAAGSSSSPAHNAVLNALVTEVDRNNRDSLPHAAGFYGALVSDGSLWSSSALRDNNGPWTIGIRELTNKYASDTALASFFDGWSGGAAALDGAVAPDYKLTTVYNASPARSLTDMVLEAGPAEAEDVVTAEEDVTAYEWGKIAFEKGVLSATDFEEAMSYGSSGDTLSLAEHHIYGSSRLGVQRYDSLGLANITHLPAESAMYARTTLNNRRPWYSYTYADLIDRDKRTEYDGTVNTCTDTLYNSRTLGRRYYELTDHLGNVLATVLDRKTGVKVGEAPTLYDHWSADLASVADYYPGGMMMPGRNLEHDWSRMGSQSQQKDDEIYGKGNVYAFKYRMEDARINRFFSPDPLHGKYPHNSDYAFSENRLIDGVELEGLEFNPFGASNTVVNFYIKGQAWLNRAHAEGVKNYQTGKAAQQQAISQGRSDGDGITNTTLALVYLAPFWNSVAPMSDANDGAVLLEGRNLDGEKASKLDYVFASVGAGIPFISGSGVKKALQGFIKSEKGLSYGGKIFSNAAEFGEAVTKMGGNPREKRALIETVTRQVAQSNGWKKSSKLSGSSLGEEVYELGGGRFASTDKFHGNFEIFEKKGNKFEHQGSIDIDGTQNKGRNSDYDVKQ